MKEESVHLGGARIQGSIFSKALGDCCPTLDHSNFKGTSAGDTPAPASLSQFTKYQPKDQFRRISTAGTDVDELYAPVLCRLWIPGSEQLLLAKANSFDA